MLMEKELSPIREISPEEETAASLADVYDQLGTISNRFRSLEEGKRSSDDKIETLSGKIVTQDQKLDAIGRKLELVLQSLPRIETVREFGGTSRDNSSRSQDIRNQVPNSISESCRREVRTGIRENLLKNVEIPVFEGLNIYSWIARVERIFRIGNYNDAEKLELVSVSLDGEALSWFNWEINRRQFQSWIQFKSGLMLRFGNLKIGGPSQSLFCIKQTGSIAEYVQKFEDLSSQVTGLDDQKLEDPFDVDDDSHQGKETISLTESIEEPELIQDTKSVLVTELIEGQKDDQDAEACCVTESFAMELVIAEEAVGKKRGRQQESFCETELIATLEMNNSIQDLESREATYSNLVTDLLHQTKLISHRPVTISDLEQRHPKNLLRFIDMNMVIEHRSLGELDEQFYVFHVKNGDVFYQKTTCVNAKVFAHQLFYILLQRGNNMHQLLKKHKSLKSWRFKFKTRTEEHTLTDQKLLFEDESFVVAAITQEESKLQLKHTWKSKQLQFVQDFKSATSTLWLALLVSTTNQMKSLHTEIFIIQGTGHCIVTKRNDPHLWHCWKKKTGNLLEISVLPMLCLLSFQPSNRKSLLSSLSGPIAEDNETILWSLIHYGDREIDATTELQAVFELILKRYNVWEDCTKVNGKLQLQFRRGKDITTILVVLPVSSPSKIHGVPHALEEDKELKQFIEQVHDDQIKAGYKLVNSSYFLHIAVIWKEFVVCEVHMRLLMRVTIKGVMVGFSRGFQKCFNAMGRNEVANKDYYVTKFILDAILKSRQIHQILKTKKLIKSWRFKYKQMGQEQFPQQTVEHKNFLSDLMRLQVKRQVEQTQQLQAYIIWTCSTWVQHSEIHKLWHLWYKSSMCVQHLYHGINYYLFD